MRENYPNIGNLVPRTSQLSEAKRSREGREEGKREIKNERE